MNLSEIIWTHLNDHFTAYFCFRGSKFRLNLVDFSLHKRIHKKWQFKASKIAKMADFALPKSPKLISRKIWVIEILKFPHWVGVSRKVTYLSYIAISTGGLETRHSIHYVNSHPPPNVGNHDQTNLSLERRSLRKIGDSTRRHKVEFFGKPRVNGHSNHDVEWEAQSYKKTWNKKYKIMKMAIFTIVLSISRYSDGFEYFSW